MSEQKTIYNMELHEEIPMQTICESIPTTVYSIVRVAGGWIYKQWCPDSQMYISSTFVPYSPRLIR
jgi:hypothetical protein